MNVKNKSGSKKIHNIELIDKTGNLVKKVKLDKPQGEYQLNVQGLKQDVYYLRIFDGKSWQIQQVIIQ